MTKELSQNAITRQAAAHQRVRIKEVVVQRLAEQLADSRLAAAHHAHQVQAGAAQLVLHRSRHLLRNAGLTLVVPQADNDAVMRSSSLLGADQRLAWTLASS